MFFYKIFTLDKVRNFLFLKFFFNFDVWLYFYFNLLISLNFFFNYNPKIYKLNNRISFKIYSLLILI